MGTARGSGPTRCIEESAMGTSGACLFSASRSASSIAPDWPILSPIQVSAFIHQSRLISQKYSTPKKENCRTSEDSMCIKENIEVFFWGGTYAYMMNYKKSKEIIIEFGVTGEGVQLTGVHGLPCVT